ncbi:QRFP-like peptide receptor [Lineus longissimus]|uniref:QRFP-like peptide receptor n=1 Tax=Lineus longissimus TaxID=88925 RepID=UPI00315DBBDF
MDGINIDDNLTQLIDNFNLSEFGNFSAEAWSPGSDNDSDLAATIAMPFGRSKWMDNFDMGDVIRKNFIRVSTPPVITLIVLYILTFLSGLLGNVLVIFVFWRNRRMRTVTNSFLVNLAVCDLMVVCICMPFTLAVDVYTNWIYGDVMCKIVNFTQGLSVSSSILTLSVISAERFMAINKPLKARAFLTRQRAYKILFVLWLVSGIIVLPELIFRHDRIIETIFVVELRACVETWYPPGLKYAYVFSLLILTYLIPLLTIIVGYVRISAKLWRKDEHLHAGQGSGEGAFPKQAAKALASRRKVAKMLVVLVILFALSWLPKHTTSLLLDFLSKDGESSDAIQALRKTYSFALWFALSNSSLNPICYCLMSESFKNAYKRAFRCCFDAGAILRRDSSLSISTQATNANRFLHTRRQSLTRETLVDYHDYREINV